MTKGVISVGKRKQKKFTVVADYMQINGVWTEVDVTDPKHAEFHDKCKLAWLEMSTGVPHRIVKRKKSNVS